MGFHRRPDHKGPRLLNPGGYVAPGGVRWPTNATTAIWPSRFAKYTRQLRWNWDPWWTSGTPSRGVLLVQNDGLRFYPGEMLKRNDKGQPNKSWDSMPIILILNRLEVWKFRFSWVQWVERKQNLLPLIYPYQQLTYRHSPVFGKKMISACFICIFPTGYPFWNLSVRSCSMESSIESFIFKTL